MILAITALEITIPVVVVLLVIVCLLLILLVMMQKPKQEGLGAAFGGGTAGEVFGARTTDVLQKGTIYLGVLFFGLTLLLAILTAADNKAKGKLEVVADKPAEVAAQPESPAPVIPEPAPVAPEPTAEDSASSEAADDAAVEDEDDAAETPPAAEEPTESAEQ